MCCIATEYEVRTYTLSVCFTQGDLGAGMFIRPSAIKFGNNLESGLNQTLDKHS